MSDDARAKKELIAEVFDRAASGYGRLKYFPLFGRRLVEMAQIPGGAKVLDVASGRGAVLFPAAKQVGPRGRIIGIDLSEGMVQETGAEIRRRGLQKAEIRQMDAERLEFPDASFDYVLCGFSLFFFPHLQRALTEFRRVLKSQGRLAATTWGDDDERWNWYDEVRNSYQLALKVRSWALDKRDELQAVFSQAGFSDIHITTEEADWVFGDEEEWWAMQWSTTNRATLEKMAPDVLERFKAEVSERMQALKQPDGMHYRLQVHFALATKP